MLRSRAEAKRATSTGTYFGLLGILRSYEELLGQALRRWARSTSYEITRNYEEFLGQALRRWLRWLRTRATSTGNVMN